MNFLFPYDGRLLRSSFPVVPVYPTRWTRYLKSVETEVTLWTLRPDPVLYLKNVHIDMWLILDSARANLIMHSMKWVFPLCDHWPVTSDQWPAMNFMNIHKIFIKLINNHIFHTNYVCYGSKRFYDWLYAFEYLSNFSACAIKLPRLRKEVWLWWSVASCIINPGRRTRPSTGS